MLREMGKYILLTTLILANFQLIKSQTLLAKEQVYNEDEKKALNELRHLAKDLFYLDYHSEDGFLINWLQSNKLNVEKTKAALEMSFKYRRANGIDRITDEPEMLQLLKTFPATFGKSKDRTGSPAWQMVTSTWDIRRGMLGGKKDLMNRYVFFMLESISNVTRRQGVSQWILLNDLSNYNIRKHGCLACIPFLLQFPRIYEQHFFNAKYIVLYNAPRVFETMSRLIFSVMSPETVKICKIFGTDKTEWQTFMLSVFAPNELSPQFGGTKLSKS